MISKDIEYIKSISKESLLLNESMAKHTTFGVGGVADCYIMPKDISQLKKILKYTYEKDIKTFFMGSGSNLLVSDNGYRGIIISLKKTFKNLEISNNGTINVESGVMLGKMVRQATKEGLQGMESLVGVPGTVGGALYMNAGAYKDEISNYFHSALLLDKSGQEKVYSRNEIKFSYRYSSFPEDEILIKAIFHYKYGDTKTITANKKIASDKRKKTQPLKYRSAGSIFKNPSEEIAAGYLIDQAGLKGMKIGGAEISEKHANFIINKGGAKSKDIISLIEIIKKEVLNKFNIQLKLEIKLLGF
tara:strand:- start:6413 stop:7321 length:909 start_codon:yes stop_codon:yes gene_type:complete